MSVIPGTNRPGKGLGGGRPHIAVAVYDSAVDSKTEGEKTLRGDTIPAGAIITDSLIVVDTPLASGGAAKLQISAQSAGDLHRGPRRSLERLGRSPAPSEVLSRRPQPPSPPLPNGRSWPRSKRRR